MRTMKHLLAGLLLMSVAALASAEERKLVYDLKLGNAERVVGYLFDDIKYNAAYYAEHGHDFRAAVVISGQAYRFFVEDIENSPYKDDPELPAIQAKFRPILEELVADYGVEFRMCVVGMERQGLTADLLAVPVCRGGKIAADLSDRLSGRRLRLLAASLRGKGAYKGR